MTGFTKLFASIVMSTIWREDDKTRIVWITLLALSDKDGVVEGSIPGLAHVASVSIEDCERALETLQKPDKYSRSPEHDSRRIEPVYGGWLILNRTSVPPAAAEAPRRRGCLTEKESAFCDAYTRHDAITYHNKTRSHRAAGYTANNERSRRILCHEVFNRPIILRRIAELERDTAHGEEARR